MSEKKPRGRPAKKVNITNISSDTTLNTNENISLNITDNIINPSSESTFNTNENISLNTIINPSEIKKVGRPKKYSDEERQQKYKESKLNWAKENSKNRIILTEEYNARTRHAYKILCEMWKNNYFDDKEEDKFKDSIKSLIEYKLIK